VRILGLWGGLTIAGPGLLGFEAFLATRGEVPPPLPAGISGCVGCDGTVPPLRTFWLGDSTAAGVGVTTPEAVLGRQVARRLGRPVHVEVLASGGTTVADVVAQQLPRVPADAEIVFVSVGANDATHLTLPGKFVSGYKKLVEGVPPNACLVLLGVPDMGSPPRLAQPLRAVTGWRARMLAKQVRQFAESSGSTFVDIAGTTGPAFRRDRSHFASDGYHPSESGYALWAGAVTSAMTAAGVPGEKCP
jgi:lysophospholipase L1-like esterase